MPTDFLWLLIRVRCSGAHELPQVHQLQTHLELFPLSALGSGHVPQRGVYDPANDVDARFRLRAMVVEEYFNRFNTLAVRNPGTAADQAVLRRFASLGIGAGLTFQLDCLPPPTRKRAARLPTLPMTTGWPRIIVSPLSKAGFTWPPMCPSSARTTRLGQRLPKAASPVPLTWRLIRTPRWSSQEHPCEVLATILCDSRPEGFPRTVMAAAGPSQTTTTSAGS